MRCQGVGNSANDRKLIRTLGQFWKMLRDFHSSDLRFHGRELPTDFSRRVGFGIEGIEMRRATRQIHKDGRPNGLTVIFVCLCRFEELAERQTSRSKNTNLQRITSEHTIAISIESWHLLYPLT